MKTLLIFSLVIALSFSLFGCKLLPWGDSAAEETAALAELPQWLTLAHRAEAAEEPVLEEEEKVEEEEEEESAEAPAPAATTQPATSQPAATTPAQTSGTPLWQQPGTMEYLAKLQLDQAAEDVRSLNSQISNASDKEQANNYKATRNSIVKTMYTIGEKIGLNVQSVYGIPPVASGATGSGEASWFVNWNESPSGFGN